MGVKPVNYSGYVPTAKKTSTIHPNNQDIGQETSKTTSAKPVEYSLPVEPQKKEAFGMTLPETFREKRPYAAAAYDTLKEGIATPAVHMLDVASGGNIGGLARSYGEELPQPKTLPGEILKTTGQGIGLFVSPLYRAINKIGVPIVDAAVKSKSLSRPLAGAITGGLRGMAAGAATSPKDILDIGDRIRQAVSGGIIGGTIGGVAGEISQLMRSKPEKVNAIRQGMKDWWKSTSKQYGKLLKQAGVEGGDLDPIDTLDYMEKELVSKGVIDRAGKIIAQPQDKVDRAFLKNYTQLRDKFLASSGKIPAKEVITASRNIQAAGRRASKFKPTSAGSEASRLKSGIEDTFKNKLVGKGKSFEEAQSLWANMRNKFDVVDKHFDVWGNNIATGKGEQSLNKIMSSGELRTVADIVKEQTGISLTGDKILSVLSSPTIRNTAATLGVTTALIYALSGKKNSGGQDGAEYSNY